MYINQPRFFSEYKLRYTITNRKHRQLFIKLPKKNGDNSSIHKAYLMSFALYINELGIIGHDIRFNKHLFYYVLNYCTALEVYSINTDQYYAENFSQITNTTLCKLMPKSHAMTHQFLELLSNACINLCMLALFTWSRPKDDVTRIVMPRIDLQWLDLSLGS
jgi:hypothetical protein